MKQFRCHLCFFSFLFCSFLSKAQFDNVKYDKESFLIGTLNEYMGYQRTFTNKDDFNYQRVDIMSKYDLKNALFIDSLFSSNYPDITIVNNGAPQGIKICSPTLSSKIDDYYNYKPGSIKTMQGDTVYAGKLKIEKFETEKQKLSFLLGAYLRYGTNMDRTNSIIQLLKKENLLSEDKEYEDISYAFFMPNAKSKAEICMELLNDFSCENVEYVHRRSLPAGNFVIFKPSKEIQEIIDDAERLEKYIETINTNYVEFTPNGTKFIWVEPLKPSFNNDNIKQKLSTTQSETSIKPIDGE